jgi:hypothetical protein
MKTQKEIEERILDIFSMSYDSNDDFVVSTFSMKLAELLYELLNE